MAKDSGQAIVITPRSAGKEVHRPLSLGWKNAAGMLRRHKRGLDRYISRGRKEWK